MKDIIQFLVYKLFKMAKLQEATVPVSVGFLVNISVFGLLHFAIVLVFFKILGFDWIQQYTFPLVFSVFIMMAIFNYYNFIRNKKIYKIHEYYETRGYNRLKGNLFFWGYIIFIFLLIFLETIIFERINT